MKSCTTVTNPVTIKRVHKFQSFSVLKLILSQVKRPVPFTCETNTFILIPKPDSNHALTPCYIYLFHFLPAWALIPLS